MSVKGNTMGTNQHFIGQTNVEDVLRFQMDRLVTQLFKTFLVVIEDLADDHDEALQRIEDALPTEYKPYVKLADYFDEARAARLRSKILDAGNGCLRDLQTHIDHYEISLKQPKN